MDYSPRESKDSSESEGGGPQSHAMVDFTGEKYLHEQILRITYR